MAKLTINVELNSTAVKTSLNDLKSQMTTIVTELNKISVSKDLTAQINSLAKLYKEMASAAKEAYKTTTAENDKAEQSATKTANALAKLTEQYGKLNAKLTEAKTKSTATDYSELEKQIQANSEAVKNLNESFKTHNSLSKEAKEVVNELTVECGEFSSTVDVMVAKDKELAKALREEEKAAKEASKAEREAEEAKEESTTSTNKTINAVESLRKQYADLLNTLKTLNQQYSEKKFDATKTALQNCYTEVNKLSQELKENKTVTEEQTKQLAKLQTSYKTLAADVSATKEATDKLKSTEPLQPNYTSTINQVQKGYAQLLQTIKNTEKYYKKGTFSTYKTQIEQALPAVEQLNTANQQTNTLTAEQQAQLEQLATALELLKSEYQTTAATQKNFHGKLKDIVSGFVNFQASAMLVMKPLQLIRSALSSINETLVETEDAIIEIQRVLNETISNSEVSSELYDLAKEYGQTFSNVAEIAQNFVKSGLSWDEAIEATEAALLALNVAELDAEEASEGLIAIMTQFGYTASDLTDIVDILNKTADNAAVTTEELLEALQKTGSYAAAANLSLEETVAIITALSEATAASGSNLGTSLKSLLAYTTKSSSLSVFSQLSDDMANVVSLYQVGKASILDIWEQLSVEMQSLTAEQADLLSQWSEDTGLEDELANELSEIYDSLTGVYDTAGTYRKNYFIALLNNMDEVEEALDNLTDAAGYSAEENETYLESYTAKLNTLQATWESLISDEENWLSFKKWLVDVGQAVLDIVDNIGGLTTVLMAAGTALAACFGTQIITGIVKGIKNMSNAVVSLAKNIKDGTQYTKLQTAATEAQTFAEQQQQAALQAATTLQALRNSGTATAEELKAAETAVINANTLAQQANTAATTAATAATQAFATAVNTVLGIAGLLVTVIYSIVNAVQSAQEEAAEAAEEARQSAISAAEAIQEETQELANLYAQLEKLTAKEDLTADETEELTDVTEALAEALGITAESFDNASDSAEAYIQKLKEASEETLYQYLQELNAGTNAAAEELENYDSSYSTKGEVDSTTYAFYKQLAETYGLSNYETTYSKNGAYTPYGTSSSYSVSGINIDIDTGNAFTDLEAIQEWLDALTDSGLATSEQLSWLYDDLYAQKESIEETIGDSVETWALQYALQQKLIYGATVDTEEAFNEMVQTIVDKYGIVGDEYIETVESMVKYIYGYVDATEDATEATNELVDAIAALSDDSLDALVEALEAARDAQEESLELAEKQLAVKEAEEALENAKNQRSVRTLNAETGQWEYVANQSDVEDAEADLQDAIDALNEYVEEQAWDSVIDELESGNATTDSILEILNTWLGASDYDEETPSWYSSIIDTIEDTLGLDVNGDGTTGTTSSSDSSSDSDTSSDSSDTSSDNTTTDTSSDSEWTAKAKEYAEQMHLFGDASASGMKADHKGDNGIVSYGGRDYKVEEGAMPDDLVNLYNAAYGVKGWNDRSVFEYGGKLYCCNDGTILSLQKRKTHSSKSNDYLDLYAAGQSAGYYDQGGIASGLGFMAKATNLPESVNDPELTSKILSPVSNAQFDRYVQDMGLLFETARRYDNQSNNATIQAMGNTTNNSTDNSITINGVTLGSDMGNRSLNEIISMLSLIPNH